MKKTDNNKTRKLNNAGISLIELIIVVAILAVIVIPFTHSFVSAANTNAKSQKTLRATTICENAMELLENISPEDAATKFGVDRFDPDVYDSTTGIWKYNITGDKLGEANASDYDIEIVLDPSTKYSAQNSENVTDIEAISADNSGVYSMPLFYEHDQVLAYYRGLKASLTDDDFNRNYSRTLTIRITKLGEKINAEGVRVPIVKAEVIIHYEAPASAGISGTDRIYEDKAELFNNMSTEKPLNSLYLFYIPRYDCLSGDPIIIENEGNVPFNCYIIRGNRGINDAGIDVDAAKLPGYKAAITVKERQADASTGLANLSLRTNLFQTTGDIFSSAKYYSLKYTETLAGSSVENDAAATMLKIRAADGRSFDSTTVVNRIYSMTVKVSYKGTVLATMTGTKTN